MLSSKGHESSVGVKRVRSFLTLQTPGILATFKAEDWGFDLDCLHKSANHRLATNRIGGSDGEEHPTPKGRHHSFSIN